MDTHSLLNEIFSFLERNEEQNLALINEKKNSKKIFFKELIRLVDFFRYFFIFVLFFLKRDEEALCKNIRRNKNLISN